ncbi:MAG: adenylate/guanylate cyclase domain-containing protein [Caulobacteraceae bacterium]
MAVFGVLPADDGADAPPPALAALRCARALLAQGGSLRPVVVGLHFGQVISGEIGSDRQKAFGVVGDSVNLARRMLDAARARGGGGLATADFVHQIQSGGETEDPRLDDAGVTAVRGFADTVSVWALRP